MHRAPPKPHGAPTSCVCKHSCDGAPGHPAGITPSATILWSPFSARPTPAFSGGQGRPKAEQCPSVCNGLLAGMVSPLILWRKGCGLGMSQRGRPLARRSLLHRARPPAEVVPHFVVAVGQEQGERPRLGELAPTGGAEGAIRGRVQRGPDCGSSLTRLNLQAFLAPAAEPRPGTEPRRSHTKCWPPPLGHAATASCLTGATCGSCNPSCDGVPRRRAGVTSSAPILWSIFSAQPTPAFSSARAARVCLKRSVGRLQRGPRGRIAGAFPLLACINSVISSRIPCIFYCRDCG